MGLVGLESTFLVATIIELFFVLIGTMALIAHQCFGHAEQGSHSVKAVYSYSIQWPIGWRWAKVWEHK